MTRNHEGWIIVGLLAVAFLSGYFGVSWLIVPAFLIGAALL
jgi:hypothetical protein